MLAQQSQAQEQAQASEQVSEAGSSSLSELEDMPDDQQDYNRESEGDDVLDNDTEASTERIDPSPQKARELHTRQLSGLDLLGDAAAVEQLQEAENLAEEAIEDVPEQDMDDLPVPAEVIEPAFREAEKEVPLESPRKRKRSSSLSDLEESEEDAPLAKKRSASVRSNILAPERRPVLPHHTSVENNEAQEDEDAAQISSEDDTRPSSREGLNEQIELVASTAEEAQADEDDQLSDEAVQPTAEPDGSAENKLATADAGVEEREAEQDQDADDAAAKTEDEALRKTAALDDLKPIENLFAILRDKLFDERLAGLSAEIASLQLPAHTITHPDFLARRACIDARRNDKIRMAEVELQYKAGALERKALADRAIAHSQYVQAVRQIREEHLSKMNTHFCGLQRERRRFKSRDPHYIYRFPERRPGQIKMQQGYNKEVSLLSGLARHEGFPAAPDLESARQLDKDDDLRRIRTMRQQVALDRTHFALAMTPSHSHLSHLTTSTPLINGSLATPQPSSNPHSGIPHSAISASNHLPFSNLSAQTAALSATSAPVNGRSAREMSYAARIANEEMSGAEEFMGRNPWARGPSTFGSGLARWGSREASQSEAALDRLNGRRENNAGGDAHFNDLSRSREHMMNEHMDESGPYEPEHGKVNGVHVREYPEHFSFDDTRETDIRKELERDRPNGEMAFVDERPGLGMDGRRGVVGVN
ncbi:MAG: hypothetical protein Q9159_003905 [Coniocarpon cinnabarinum]